MLNKKTFNMSSNHRKAIYQPICFQISTQILPYITPYVPYIYIYLYLYIYIYYIYIYIILYIHIYISPYVSHGTETIHVWCHFRRGPKGLEFRTRSRLDVALGERGAAPPGTKRGTRLTRLGGCVDMVTWEMIGKKRQHYGNE